MNVLQNWSVMTAIKTIASVLLLQGVLYFGSEKFQTSAHNVEREFDKKIPFAPAWVFVYVMWFPLIALCPLSLFMLDKRLFFIYMIAIVADIIISTAVYICYPTTFDRPMPPDTICGRFMKLVYTCSYKGVNCAPSMHCSQSYLIMTMAYLCQGMPLWLKCIFIIIPIGIVYATMATKQHTVIDVLTAIPTALVCALLGFISASIFL